MQVLKFWKSIVQVEQQTTEVANMTKLTFGYGIKSTGSTLREEGRISVDMFPLVPKNFIVPCD